MYLTHFGTRIWRVTFHIPFKKWFLEPPKLCCTLGIREKNFFFNFECYESMILQTVRAEYVRFGGHVHMEVRYKILQLEILYKAPSLHNSPSSQ
jgi:hypothetical protein